jgi:hypothetical protein
VKLFGQEVINDMGGLKSIALERILELEPFMQLLYRDGFGDIL